MLKRTFLLPCLLALIATPAFAEPASPPPSGKSAERLKQTRGEILRRRLGLDEKKASEVEKVLQKYAPERKKLRETLREQQQALRQLLAKNSDDQPSYKRALDAIADSEVRLNALRQQQRLELGKLMTPKQQAQLLEVMGKARRGMRGEHGKR